MWGASLSNNIVLDHYHLLHDLFALSKIQNSHKFGAITICTKH